MTVEPLDLDELGRTRYADVEELLITWITGAMGNLDMKVSAELPEGDNLAAALAEHPYYVQVEAFGGADRNPAQDVVNVDVDVFVSEDAEGNPNRAGASDAAGLLRSALLFHLPGYDNGHATVSEVRTISRPTARPYDDNSTMRRFSAAYQLVVKSHN